MGVYLERHGAVEWPNVTTASWSRGAHGPGPGPGPREPGTPAGPGSGPVRLCYLEGGYVDDRWDSDFACFSQVPLGLGSRGSGVWGLGFGVWGLGFGFFGIGV